MKVLVIGSGGREHALCWKISQSALVKEVYCAPGNPGIFTVAAPACAPATEIALAVDNLAGLLEFAKSNQIDLTVVGPELPLSLGVVDLFRKNNLKIFGPTKAAAQLEYSKSFAKEILVAANVPTAHSITVTSKAAAVNASREFSFPVVLKADGLAAGKGVFICQDVSELEHGLDQVFGALNQQQAMLEQFIVGQEISLIVATDGNRIVPFALSNDYKRLLDRDLGPNTGGMGCLSPTPRASDAQILELVEAVIAPVLSKLKEKGVVYSGFLYAGLMIAPDGTPFVLEFNARMGDPECQALMRRTQSDIVPLLLELSDAKGDLDSTSGPCIVDTAGIILTNNQVALAVLAARGYPDNVEKGDLIEGIEFAETQSDVKVFHAGTAYNSQGKLMTAGGRVLNVTATGHNLEAALRALYRACDMIQFRGVQLRRDIGK